MKGIIEKKHEFEKSILNVLEAYGFKVNEVTRIKIDCKLDCLPDIQINYCKQTYSLRTKIIHIFRRLKLRIKYLFKSVR